MMNGLRDESGIDFIFKRMQNSFKNSIYDDIEKCNRFNEEEKIKHIIAARYLTSIKKGPVAQELAYIISENHKNRGKPEYFEFNVPNYISEAIEWICQE